MEAPENEFHDPAVGDSVLVTGTIKSIKEGVATVEVYRSWPLKLTVDVQCGALKCNEKVNHNSGQSDDMQPVQTSS